MNVLNKIFVIVTICTIIIISPVVYSSGKSSTMERNNSHVTVENILTEIYSEKETAMELISKGKLKGLNRLLSKIDVDIFSMRGEMDDAMFLGAWKKRGIKKEAQLLTDHLESLRILNYIGLGFSSEYYDYPDNYIPDSVKLSVEKFYVHLELLRREVIRTNSKVRG